jgi:hypothetical protein
MKESIRGSYSAVVFPIALPGNSCLAQNARTRADKLYLVTIQPAPAHYRAGAFCGLLVDRSLLYRSVDMPPIETVHDVASSLVMELETAHSFANRTAELENVDESIEQLKRGGSVQFCFTNYFGVPGMGKTALLAEIDRRHRDDPRLLRLLLDLKQWHTPRLNLHSAKVAVLHALLDQLPPDSRAVELPGRASQLAEIGDDDGLTEALDLVARYLAGQPRPVLLVADSWEHAPETLFAWVEHRLLLPLIIRDQVLGLFGSQAPLRWRQYEARRRVKAVPLTPLDQQATGEQVGVPGDVAEQIFDITFGLPLGNWKIQEALGPHQADPATWLGANRGKLAGDVVQEIFGRVLVEVSDDLQAILNVTALLGQFDVTTLHAILPRIYPDFTGRSQSALLLAVRQMSEMRLLRWIEDRRAYELDPTLRSIFARQLELNKPDLYARIRAAALAS